MYICISKAMELMTNKNFANMETLKFKNIIVNGFSSINACALWDGHSIETYTTYDPADFDFGDDTENELIACREFIQEREVNGDWIPGQVQACIEYFEYEVENDDEMEELNKIVNHFTELYSDEIKNNEITKDTIHEWWNYTKDQYSQNIKYEKVENGILKAI